MHKHNNIWTRCKLLARYKPLTTYPYLRGTSGADPNAPQRNRTTKELLILTAILRYLT